MKTLIADDDLTTRHLLQRMLAPHGHVHACVSGVEAVELFRLSLDDGEPYDLVCLDILMPNESGLTALTRIRELEGSFLTAGRSRCKILMVTGMDDSRSVMTAFRNFCDGYLRKPIDAAGLFRQIEDLLPLQRA